MYSAVLCFRADSMRTLACGSEWVTVSFYSTYPRKWCTGSALWLLHGWCHVKCCRFGASSVYIIQPCTWLQCHFIQSHIVHVCLAVTCHLHFWQNDWDLLHATAVTWGWNRYRNKVSTESWPWRSKLSCRSCRDSNPQPFNHESGALTTELSCSPILTCIAVCCPIFHSFMNMF